MADAAGAPSIGRYRGYLAARPGVGRSVPQGIQQLVMRDYCASRGMTYLLAATEYCMPGSTMMLNSVLADLDHLDGIVCYSMFSLPEDRGDRLRVYRRVVAARRSLHMAAERLVVCTLADAERLEDTWMVKTIIDGQEPDVLRELEAWDQHHAGD